MKTLVAVLMTLPLVALLACDDEEKYTLRFNHVLHVEDMGLACEDCHGDVTAGDIQTPDHDTCIDCHEDIIDADIAEDTCGTCHVEKDLDMIGMEESPEAPTTGAFRHSEALEGQCATCHGGVLDADAEFVAVTTRDDILAMRRKAHASNQPCQSCHENLDENWVPDSHAGNWEKLHGPHARVEEELCQTCHLEQTCDECHQQTPPQSHNNLFRVRTHGIEARWNRESCQTCHMDDFCASCHMEVEPVSHGAGWQQRHCLNCHASQDAGSGCETCHPNSIETHDLTMPAFHSNLLEVSCFLSGCHGPADGGAGIRLMPSRHPFLDPGECLNCHRL